MEVLHMKEMMKTLPCEQGHQSHYTHTQTDATARSFYIHMYSSFTTIPMRSDGHALRLSGTNGMIRSLMFKHHYYCTTIKMPHGLGMIATTSNRLQKVLKRKKVIIVMARME